MPKAKASQYATKQDVKEIVQQAADAIVSAMDRMFENVPTRTEFNKLQADVDEIKRDVHFIKDDVKNIEADVSVLQIKKGVSYV